MEEQTNELTETTETPDVTPEVSETTEHSETPSEITPAATPAETTARGKDAPITQERFDEIYGRMSRAEREIQRMNRPSARQEQPESKAKPKEEDYDNYSDFVENLADWKVEQREIARITETNKKSQERVTSDREYIFEANIASAEKVDPQFRERGYIHADIKPLVYDSENFAGLAYYFKQHPGETERILSMAPDLARAAREIGRIEAFLQRPKPRTETNAPSATKPVGVGVPTEKKAEDMTENEYMAHRKKQLYGR